ncbi:flagellar filament capping protein FliD [bacterium]|nr:flagellar filament capping protein FliD [bacterium]
MAALSSISGTLSSVEQLVQQSIAQSYENKHITQLENSKSTLNSTISVYSSLKTKLKTLSDRLEKFTEVGADAKISAKTAESSDAKVFTAEASSSASVGVNSLFVSRLASRDTAVSKQKSNLDSTSMADKLLGTQTIRITIGDNDPIEISIDVAADDTKEDIMNNFVDAINSSGAAVTASYIKDTPDTARISIISKESGSTNQMSLEEVGDAKILQNLGFITLDDDRPQSTGTGGGFLIVDPNDLNAEFTLNGIAILKESNTISDVLQGVTIKLISAQEEGESPETLTIVSDSETVKSELEAFITDYNEVIKFLNSETGIDSTTYERGAFTGKYSYTNLKLNIRALLSSPVDSVEEGAPSMLTQIGIEINRDGTLKIGDEDKLSEYMESGNSSILNLFNSENGIAYTINNYLERFVKTGGIVDDDKKLLNTRIKNIDSRVEDFEYRLQIRANTLRQQYAALQKMLSRLNSQQAMINNAMSLYGYGSSGYGAY